MDAQYITQECAIALRLNPNEASAAAEIIQKLIEDERLKTLVRIPVFEDQFLKDLSMATKDVHFKFDAAAFEFGVAFLEEMAILTAESGNDPGPLEEFLDYVEQFCAPSPVLH